ncbi:MAG: biopolymer transporter ExbD [Acidobacteria bacterium]|nr:biopolymer transporter ExbD [Acidobacteriota bacterium]
MAFTNPQGRTQTSLADINITPLVDVVLVLLIIFMLTTPVLQSGIDVSVPKTKTVREVTQQRLVITIDRQERVYLGGMGKERPINVNEIAGLLRGHVRPDQPIYVRADENVHFGVFAAVMDYVKQAGITNISVVTQPMSESGR